MADNSFRPKPKNRRATIAAFDTHRIAFFRHAVEPFISRGYRGRIDLQKQPRIMAPKTSPVPSQSVTHDPMARIDPLRDPAREIEFPGNAAVHLAFDAELGKTSTTEAAEHSVDKAGLIQC